jgi:hypothetical protein
MVPYKGSAVSLNCIRYQHFFMWWQTDLPPPPHTGLFQQCREALLLTLEQRFEPNFVPVYALCKIRDLGSKYRCCPYFRILVQFEIRNKRQSENLNTEPNNRQPPNMDRALSSVQSIHQENPSFKTLHSYSPMILGNAWARPLNCSITQLPKSPVTLRILAAPKSRRSVPKLARKKESAGAV